MKLLVVGGSGLVGSHVVKAARGAGHEVMGTFRKFPLPGLVPFETGDPLTAAKLLDTQRPDAVVHAAGWTWVDGCEDDPARAYAENAAQPAELAALCQQRSIHFTYFSTSYIFDGRNGPYAETDAPNPINVYAKSKWQGEQLIRQATAGTALLPRVICVYGAETQKKNFAYQVWQALRDGKAMTLPADQRGNPTYAGDIARWLVKLVERRAQGPWHLGGPWPHCTRIEWAEKLVAALVNAGVKPHRDFQIKAVTTAELKQKALRPLMAGMISSKPDGLDFQPTDFDHAIGELVGQSA